MALSKIFSFRRGSGGTSWGWDSALRRHESMLDFASWIWPLLSPAAEWWKAVVAEPSFSESDLLQWLSAQGFVPDVAFVEPNGHWEEKFFNSFVNWMTSKNYTYKKNAIGVTKEWHISNSGYHHRKEVPKRELELSYRYSYRWRVIKGVNEQIQMHSNSSIGADDEEMIKYEQGQNKHNTSKKIHGSAHDIWWSSSYQFS